MPKRPVYAVQLFLLQRGDRVMHPALGIGALRHDTHAIHQLVCAGDHDGADLLLGPSVSLSDDVAREGCNLYSNFLGEVAPSKFDGRLR